MTNEDYQLEELENAAVNKSNNAKRILAAGGLLAGGAGAGFAATQVLSHDDSPTEQEEGLTLDDLDGVAQGGANQVQQDTTPEPEPQPINHTTQNITYVNYAPHTPPTSEPQGQEEPEVSFDKTTHYYDENHELLMTTEEGTIEGRSFILADVDNDQRADLIGYDVDGNGVISQDEISQLTGDDQIAMGHATAQHEDQFLAINDPYTPPSEDPVDPYPYDINDDEKDLTEDITNDFEDEKTGETYTNDYAENNENYNNNGDVNHYTAETQEYQLDEKDGSEYAFNEDTDIETEETESYTPEENELAYEAPADTSDEYDELAENTDTSDDTFDDLGSDDFDIA